MFNRDLLETKKTVIHCATEIQAKMFEEWCLENDIQHMNFCISVWGQYTDKTCYNIIDGTYCCIEYYERENYTILSFSEVLLEKLKYKLIKSFSVSQLIELNACEKSVKKVIEKYGVYNQIPWNSETEFFIYSNDKTWFEWLIDHKFIDDYTHFDFTNKIQSFKFDGHIFKLCKISDYHYQWCCIDKPSNKWWNNDKYFTPTKAVDCILISKHKIEIKEFDNIKDLYNYYKNDAEPLTNKKQCINLIATMKDKFDLDYKQCCDFMHNTDICYGIECIDCSLNK